MAASKKMKRILIVEDEPSVYQALQLKLKNAGYDPQVATDGVEALRHVDEETFALILLDLVMPRMDGFEFLEKMKQRNATTPVIIITNLSQKEDELRTKALGAKKFFIKADTSIAEIVDYINNMLS